MKDPIRRYLDRRADLESRPLIAKSLEHIDTVVAIPALAEFEFLPRTLESLAKNNAERLARTLVICVINNGEDADRDKIENNARTLRTLSETSFGSLRVAHVDASSDGAALAAGAGVGTARKIGLDWGVHALVARAPRDGVLVSLDADTLVEDNYLAAIRDHFDRPGAWAATIDYAHPIAGAPREQAAILCYELFLRYHVMGLRYAGSPYAFHTIGSAIACSVSAYAAVSGMNRRAAGEDFYFLQKLAKTGAVDRIAATTVHPSARVSDRVPFGTGPRIGRFIEGSHEEYRLYNPACYTVLRDWLECAARSADADAGTLIRNAESISPALAAFLDSEGFCSAWEQLQRNAGSDAAMRAQFHRWFDALKSLRLIHHLREHGYPDHDMFDAIDTLMRTCGEAPVSAAHGTFRDSPAAQRALLEQLRRLS